MLNIIGIKDVIFDCYKTLVDLRTDEKLIRPLSVLHYINDKFAKRHLCIFC
jgi:hypothetical protein